MSEAPAAPRAVQPGLWRTGFGQAVTMPLFSGSNALYPLSVMPGLLQAVSKVNPLSCQVDALRGLLPGAPSISRADHARGRDVRHARRAQCAPCRRVLPAHGLITDQRG